MTEQEQAADDLARYAKALPHPDAYLTCGAIEQRWDLYGYAPSVVCDVLARVANGEDRYAAEGRALGEVNE